MDGLSTQSCADTFLSPGLPGGHFCTAVTHVHLFSTVYPAEQKSRNLGSSGEEGLVSYLFDNYGENFLVIPVTPNLFVF